MRSWHIETIKEFKTYSLSLKIAFKKYILKVNFAIFHFHIVWEMSFKLNNDFTTVIWRNELTLYYTHLDKPESLIGFYCSHKSGSKCNGNHFVVVNDVTSADLVYYVMDFVLFKDMTVNCLFFIYLYTHTYNLTQIKRLSLRYCGEGFFGTCIMTCFKLWWFSRKV